MNFIEMVKRIYESNKELEIYLDMDGTIIELYKKKANKASNWKNNKDTYNISRFKNKDFKLFKK